MRSPIRHRGAFTLIELLVVISIIGTIAGAVLLMAPSFERQGRSSRGADLIQGWLLIAKQQALRDQRPRGLRLMIDPSNPTLVKQLIYVEEPEPYVPTVGTSLGLYFDSGANVYKGILYNATQNGGSVASETLTALQGGDWLEIKLSKNVYRIDSIDANGVMTFVAGTYIQEVSTSAGPANNKRFLITDGYQFIRAPRPMVGEDPLSLPTNVSILVPPAAPSSILPSITTVTSPVAQMYFEVVFSPSGQVVGQSSGRTVFWIIDDEGTGPASLICIYGRTGQIAAHPVSQNGDPYEFTRDGKSSGM